MQGIALEKRDTSSTGLVSGICRKIENHGRPDRVLDQYEELTQKFNLKKISKHDLFRLLEVFASDKIYENASC